MDGDFNLANRYRRKDYTTEPIRAKDSRPSGSDPKKQRTPKANRRSKKHIFILILISIVVLGFAGSLLTSNSAGPMKKDLKKAQQEITFPIYLPARIPGGYSYKEGSVNFNDGVLLFHLESGSKKIVFTIQPKPANFNFDDFNKKTLVDSKEIITPIGQGVIGTLGDKTVGSIVTEKDWILVSAPLDLANDQIGSVVKSLQIVQ